MEALRSPFVELPSIAQQIQSELEQGMFSVSGLIVNTIFFVMTVAHSTPSFRKPYYFYSIDPAKFFSMQFKFDQVKACTRTVNSL